MVAGRPNHRSSAAATLFGYGEKRVAMRRTALRLSASTRRSSSLGDDHRDARSGRAVSRRASAHPSRCATRRRDQGTSSGDARDRPLIDPSIGRLGRPGVARAREFRSVIGEQQCSEHEERRLPLLRSGHPVGVSVGFLFDLPAKRGLARSHKRRHWGGAQESSDLAVDPALVRPGFVSSGVFLASSGGRAARALQVLAQIQPRDLRGGRRQRRVPLDAAAHVCVAAREDGIPPILRSPEHLRRKRCWKDGLECRNRSRRTRSSSGVRRSS